MKLSRYTSLFKWKSRYFIYNSYYNALLEASDKLYKYLETKGSIDRGVILPDDVMHQLSRAGVFLGNDDYNTLKKLDHVLN